MTLEVQAYSGFKGDERPIRFRLGERWLGVEELVDRWYDPEAIYFRVRADDGDLYVLRHGEREDVWTLAAYRRVIEGIQRMGPGGKTAGVTGGDRGPRGKRPGRSTG